MLVRIDKKKRSEEDNKNEVDYKRSDGSRQQGGIRHRLHRYTSIKIMANSKTIEKSTSIYKYLSKYISN